MDKFDVSDDKNVNDELEKHEKEEEIRFFFFFAF